MVWLNAFNLNWCDCLKPFHEKDRRKLQQSVVLNIELAVAVSCKQQKLKAIDKACLLSQILNKSIQCVTPGSHKFRLFVTL